MQVTVYCVMKQNAGDCSVLLLYLMMGGDSVRCRVLRYVGVGRSAAGNAGDVTDAFVLDALCD